MPLGRSLNALITLSKYESENSLVAQVLDIIFTFRLVRY